MSCTSKKKTEFSGLPLLPGTRDWQKHEEKKREFRRRLENAEPVVDDKPPKADLRREINLHEMKVMQTRILMTKQSKPILGEKSSKADLRREIYLTSVQ